jgi:hypothetical protein
LQKIIKILALAQKYLHMHKILALAQNVGGFSKYRRQMYAANIDGKCRRQM